MDNWTEAERELADRVRTGRTVVVNVRKSGPHKHLVPWLVERGLLTYIGHAGNRHSWPESEFANPFVREAKLDRDAMVRHYREYLEGRADLLARLPELDGRALGCWCAPQACHGDVLLEHLK
ncbi:DUF4326 domain-containing protein [Amycolatopsis acidiphila]|uniref:DUF4326 domain-containing protein n=1 Tax=Amycolatopsis acidiphila TaxID=715473 RepID=A0A558A196_9PSEU|nr:DUF4326 domain-containing protein [Amycolatopsis acidiphila]TVT18031.1 DUF4326 domain-containing protein [Amycolatopsis acidiphila]UIJ63758.1 DUF4326 domain-containing protein [Amycolatopsis acidiphila]